MLEHKTWTYVFSLKSACMHNVIIHIRGPCTCMYMYTYTCMHAYAWHIYIYIYLFIYIVRVIYMHSIYMHIYTYICFFLQQPSKSQSDYVYTSIPVNFWSIYVLHSPGRTSMTAGLKSSMSCTRRRVTCSTGSVIARLQQVPRRSLVPSMYPSYVMPNILYELHALRTWVNMFEYIYIYIHIYICTLQLDLSSRCIHIHLYIRIIVGEFPRGSGTTPPRKIWLQTQRRETYKKYIRLYIYMHYMLCMWRTYIKTCIPFECVTSTREHPGV